MSCHDSTGRACAALAALAGLMLPAACSGGDPAGRTEPIPATPSVEIGTTRYFDDPSFVGKPVSLTGTVTRVITATSFVVDARDHGDDSVLVLSRPRTDVVEGSTVAVDGRVEVFHYATFVDGFQLASEAQYRDFIGEEFVASAQPGAAETTATPSS